MQSSHRGARWVGVGVVVQVGEGRTEDEADEVAAVDVVGKNLTVPSIRATPAPNYLEDLDAEEAPVRFPDSAALGAAHGDDLVELQL